jgi:hypothetical protein
MSVVKHKNRPLASLTALTLVLFVVLTTGSTVSSFVAKAEDSQSFSAGKALTKQQLAVKIGEEAITQNLKLGKYTNLSQLITDQVNLHEKEGFKFGGLSFSVTNGDEITHYQLSHDVLTEIVTKSNNGSSSSDIISQQDYALNPSNNSKFSTLSDGLNKKLSEVAINRETVEKSNRKALAETGTNYDSDQHSNYLNFYTSYYYFGDGYHNLLLASNNAWNATFGNADPGGKDGMDVEWNPSQYYMGSVVWQPNTSTVVPAGYWNWPHEISMNDSTLHYGASGLYYVEPDHNSKTNSVSVYLYPISDGVIGQRGNWYGNYIHTWNYFGGSTVSFSIGYGIFSLSASSSPLTGSYKINNYGIYII